MRKAGVDLRLGTVRDIVKFAFVAPWAGPVISAGGGMALLCLSVGIPWSEWASGAALWWGANALGILVVTPALLAWRRREMSGLESFWKITVALVALIAVCGGTMALERRFPQLTLVGAVAPLFVGTALGVACGLRGAATIATVAMTGYCAATACGLGQFAGENATGEALELTAYGMALSVTLLPLGAVVEELRVAKLRTALALKAGKIRLWEWRRGEPMRVEGAGLPAEVLKVAEARFSEGESGCEAEGAGEVWSLHAEAFARDARGPTHLTGVATDITEQRRSEEARLGHAVLEARLNSLRSFLDPHLLFNALAGLRATVRSHPEVALKYTEDLARFLRLSLDAGASPTHTLADELKLARAFLDFNRHRRDHEPVVEFSEIPKDLERAGVPSGLIHTLLENALKYGRPEADGRLRIGVSITLSGNNWRLTVAQPGKLDRARADSGKPGGLRNLRDQLTLLYEGRARFFIEELPAGTVVAGAEMPLS